jgi:hypothetical protein
VEYKLGGIAKIEVSIETIMSQSLFANPINRVMFVEQIFQDISKKRLEITYTLRLG